MVTEVETRVAFDSTHSPGAPQPRYPRVRECWSAGAGEGAYRAHFAQTRYEAADFQQVDKPYGQLDYVCDLDSIPVEDERYDLVLCTQVLEHLPEPADVLTELHRVLRAGGTLWLSQAPLYFPEHEQPYDFYRYTSFGLEHRLTRAGFVLDSLDWLEGYLGTLSFQLASCRSRATSQASGIRWRSGRRILSAAAACLARPSLSAPGADATNRLELRHRYTGVAGPSEELRGRRRASVRRS